MTNFEKIKSMNIDELAYFLSHARSDCECCPAGALYGYNHIGKSCYGNCQKAMTEWLNAVD